MRGEGNATGRGSYDLGSGDKLVGSEKEAQEIKNQEAPIRVTRVAIPTLKPLSFK